MDFFFSKKKNLNNQSFPIKIFSYIEFNKFMETCAICYERRAPKHFFHLTCCKNKICYFCLEKLRFASCPYCRNVIENFPIKKHKTPEVPFISRIERRQTRRFLKLELWESDRQRNRMRSFSL